MFRLAVLAAIAAIPSACLADEKLTNQTYLPVAITCPTSLPGDVVVIRKNIENWAERYTTHYVGSMKSPTMASAQMEVGPPGEPSYVLYTLSPALPAAERLRFSFIEIRVNHFAMICFGDASLLPRFQEFTADNQADLASGIRRSSVVDPTPGLATSRPAP